MNILRQKENKPLDWTPEILVIDSELTDGMRHFFSDYQHITKEYYLLNQRLDRLREIDKHSQGKLYRHMIDDILKRDGNFGCRQFVARNPDIVETVEMDSDRILLDVDRREDLEELDLGHPEQSGDRATL